MHGMIFDRSVLQEILLRSGFRSIKEWDWRQTEHFEYDDFSQAYLPHMQKDQGSLMSLNIEAFK